MKRKKMFAVPVMVVMVFVLVLSVACSLPNKAQLPTAEPSEKARYGGTLKYIFGSSPANLGYTPKFDNLFYWHCSMPALETLLRFDIDGRPLPHLATGWKIASDGKYLELTLRKGVKFHDGTDFNAGAVKYDLDLSIASKQPGLEKVTGIDVVDDYTVRLRLSEYSNALLFALGQMNGLMASPTALKKGEEWARSNPVGTGPFRLVQFVPDVSLKYERFDGYWDKGKPYLDGIEIKYIKDQMTASASFQAGEADIYWGSATTSPKNAAELSTKGYKVAFISSNIQSLLSDSKNPDSPFADRRVREALEYSIDRTAIVKALSYGFWGPLTQAAIPDHYAFNPDIKVREYNPTKAKQLLAEAGYPTGFKTKLMGSAASVNKDSTAAVQRYLSEVGITAEVELADAAKNALYYAEGWKNGLYFNMFPSTGNYAFNINRRLPINYTGAPVTLRPSRYGDLINQAFAAKDFDNQKKITRELTKLIFDEAFIVPMWDTSSFIAKQSSVQDDGHGTVLSIWWSPEKTWLKK